MNGWKSPLLWLGIAVILATAVAAIGPYWIDWTVYRADLEEYGRKLTGRNVAIEGDIDVKLFPRPVMRLGQVRIANPPQASAAALMEAGAVTVRLGLAPLIAGEIDVEKVRIEKPVFAIERLPAGGGTWKISPVGDLTGLISADKIAVSGIEIVDGTVVLGDRSRGGRARIEKVDAELSAPTLKGPWRLAGSVDYKGRALELSVTTGRWREGTALTAGIRISPAGGSGLTYTFDGALGGPDDKAIAGNIRVQPAKLRNGKGDAEQGLRPLVMRSKIAAGFERVMLTDIEIAPENAIDVNSYLTGEAGIELGRNIIVDARLSASRLDIDTMLGNRGREVIRSREAMDALAAVFDLLPDGVEVTSDIAVTSLIIGEETFEDVDARFELTGDRLKIARLSGVLGGHGRGGFTGVFLPGEDLPQLTGRLNLDQPSLRDFVRWALPAAQQTIDQRWTGARGRFKGTADIDMNAKSLRLTDLAVTLDDSVITGAVNLSGGDDPRIRIDLDVDRVDLDRYMPEGLAALGGEGMLGWVASTMALGDLDFALKSPRFTVNGTGIEALDVDVAATVDRVTVRRLRAASIGGARIDAAGTIGFPGNAVAGNLTADLAADDVSGLFRLAGLLPAGSAAPDWIAAIGKVDLSVTGEARAEDTETTASLTVKGTAAGSSFTGNGTFDGNIDRWRTADIHASLDARLASSRQVLRALDAGQDLHGDAPGRIALSATGTVVSGLAATVEADLLGIHGQFAGVVFDEGRGPEAQGRAAMLVQDAAGALERLGLAAMAAPQTGRVLAAESGLVLRDGKVALTGVNGTYGGSTVSGDLEVLMAGERPALSGSLSAGRLSLPWLLALELMPRGPGTNDASTRFAPARPPLDVAGLTVDVREMEIVPGVALGATRLDLSADETALKVQGSSPAARGLPTEFALSVARDGEMRRADGSIAASIDLSRSLLTEAGAGVLDGMVRIEAAFAGSGLSPSGILSELAGTGRYRVTGARLDLIDPAGLAAGLEQAQSARDVDTLIAEKLQTGSFAIGDGSGSLAIASGVVRFADMPVASDVAGGTLAASFDIPRGALSLSASLKLNQPADLPAFGVGYRGHPAVLHRTYDVDALKSRLAVMVLQRGIARLEELEREQRRLQEEEREARAEAEAKLRQQEAEQEQLRRRQEEYLRQQEAPPAAKPPPATAPAPQPQTRAPLPQSRPETVVRAVPPVPPAPIPQVLVEPFDPLPLPVEPFIGRGPVELVAPPRSDNPFAPGVGRQR